MLLNPPIEELVEKVGSPYELAVLVGKRAKELERELTEEQKEECPAVTRAVNEVYNGVIVEGKDDSIA